MTTEYEIQWTGENTDEVQKKFPSFVRRVSELAGEIQFANHVMVVHPYDWIHYDGERITVSAKESEAPNHPREVTEEERQARLAAAAKTDEQKQAPHDKSKEPGNPKGAATTESVKPSADSKPLAGTEKLDNQKDTK